MIHIWDIATDHKLAGYDDEKFQDQPFPAYCGVKVSMQARDDAAVGQAVLRKTYVNEKQMSMVDCDSCILLYFEEKARESNNESNV